MAVAAVAPARTLPTASAAARHYLIGLQLYSVREDLAKDFQGTLATVAKLGYSGVEFAGDYGGHTPQDLRKLLADDHLACYGAHVALTDLLGDNFAKTAAFHQALGNKMLTVPWLPDERRNTKAALIQTAKLFGDIAKKLQPYGITLAYHDEAPDFHPIDGEMPWVIFFKNADPRVKIEFDIGNALEGGAQAAPYLRMFPGRTIAAHVKDFSKTNPKVLLGDGDENWKETLPLLEGRAGTRFFIIEQETYPFPPLECAEKCLRNFEKMLATKPQ